MHTAVLNENIEIIKLLLCCNDIDVKAKDDIFIDVLNEVCIKNLMIFLIIFWRTPADLTSNDNIKALLNEHM